MSASRRENHSTSSPDELAISLPRFGSDAGPDPAIAVAAARAGACGLLDVSLSNSPEAARRAASQLRLLADEQRTGLVIDIANPKVGLAAAAELGGCECILLANPWGRPPEPMAPLDADRELVATLHGTAKRVGFVALSCGDADRGEQIGCDFLVAKGFEAGGQVAEETTFILLQRLVASSNLPVYAWGGVGRYTAAGCVAAGAAGVVLDWQLALTRESPIDWRLRRQIKSMDGSETATVSIPGSEGRCRFLHLPGMSASEELNAAETSKDFQSVACQGLAAVSYNDRFVPLGQDACFVNSWSEPTAPVALILDELRQAVASQISCALEADVLKPNGPLARSHRTEFPIVQGPMTRVSDTPEFALSVAEGGALPFLALALMREREARDMIQRTRDTLGDRSWGVGILGFVPRELREEQVRVIEEAKPPFAIIAGGRPDQAAELEAKGMATYLHVPSPGMLEMFVKEGARRFIFEGHECGGHVGPRTSLVLWESMVGKLLASEMDSSEWSRVHVLFAGGIHDGGSAAVVAALAQPLVDRGAKVGVLLGTAYLFTEEIVRAGAVTKPFQDVTIGAESTVLVETSPGHAIRCAPTEYIDRFEAEKQRLRAEGVRPNDVRDHLEDQNRGRLRIASKGIVRSQDPGDNGALVACEESSQRREGMFMLGQAAGLRRGPTTIAELHADVCRGVAATTKLADQAPQPIVRDSVRPQPLDVAIVGMSCFVPGAQGIERFWQNVLDKHDAITEVPADRFDIDRWFDADRSKRDKVYSRWGGFLPDLAFDPLRFGIPPKAMASIEPMQLIALLLVEAALADAGLDRDKRLRERTGVVLGVGGGAAELGGHYAFRSMLPKFFEDPPESFLEELPEWTEDSFAGILLNVVAGRVSNRFDLGGMNVTVDAACASSLAAIHLACKELADGAADVVIAGGCDTIQSPFGYLCFSKTGALSQRGRSRPFDESADGIAISEGHAAVVLKRLSDAERDGDRVYAVLRGVAGASDGRSKGLSAPRREGQLRTLQRAYDQAAIDPASVGLFEAHGTGTTIGDQTECEAIGELLAEANAGPSSVAIGGVKSMIGHTKCAAGVIGVIKAALALHHRVLPPTLHVERPNTKAGLINGPLYPNTKERPWLSAGGPRRAGVSAFGFGGSNFHAVLEEHRGAGCHAAAPRKPLSAELFCFRAETPDKLSRLVRSAANEVEKHASPNDGCDLADLAYTLHVRGLRFSGDRVATLVAKREEAHDAASLASRFRALADRIDGGPNGKPDRLAFYINSPLAREGKIAFLYPGQGSQFPNMMRGLSIDFPEVATAFERADATLMGEGGEAISPRVFPPPAFDENARKRVGDELKRTDRAQAALAAAGVAMRALAGAFGVSPDMHAGHSFGELVAIHAAGFIDEPTLFKLAKARGESMQAAAEAGGGGTMLAVFGPADRVAEVITPIDGVWIANRNSPKQTVITGAVEAVAEAGAWLESVGVTCRPIAVSCAFHSPLVADARELFAASLAEAKITPGPTAVYSNTTAEVHNTTVDSIRTLLADQLVEEVRFEQEVRAMHRDGARIFVEVGPHRVLSRLVADTLADEPHAAVSLGGADDCGVAAFVTGLAELAAHGAPVNLDRLYERRGVRDLNAARESGAATDKGSPHLWLVNGAYARPASEPARDPRPRHRVVPLKQENKPTKTKTPSSDPPQVEPKPAETNGQSTSSSATNTTSPPAARTLTAMSNNRPRYLTDPHTHESNGTLVPRPATVDGSVLADFQHTMRCFLQTQQAVLSQYLGSAPAPLIEAEAPHALAHSPLTAAPPSSNGAPVAAPLTEPVAPEPAFSEPTKERVEQPGQERVEASQTGSTHQEASQPSPATQPSPTPNAAPVTSSDPTQPGASADQASPGVSDAGSTLDLKEKLVEIVGERTGYPADMLELDANLEGDLGVDSIKRVEIIAAFRRLVLPDVAEPPAELMEPLAAATTLNEILAVVSEYLGGGSANATAPSDSDTAAPQVDDEDALLIAVSEVVGQQLGRQIDRIDLDTELVISEPQRSAMFAAMRSQLWPNGHPPADEIATRLADAKTLRQLLAGVVSIGGAQARISTPRSPSRKVAAAVGDRDADESGCPRCTALVVEAPPTEAKGSADLAGGAVLITEGEEGVADRLIEELIALGAAPVLAPLDRLDSRAAAEEEVARAVAEHGRVSGIVHLAPTRSCTPFPEIGKDEWRRLNDEELGGALHLIQALGPQLSSEAPPTVIAVTRDGGDFHTDKSEAGAPWRGAIAGLFKAAQCEWPNAQFRALDVDGPVEAEDILAEMSTPGPVEIGRRSGRRLCVSVQREEIADDGEALLAEHDVVLVTGGGRGITAQFVEEIASHGPAKFVLIGRTPLPNQPDDAAIASAAGENELRGAIIAATRASGEELKPVEIEGRVRHVLACREVRATLESLADAGATAEYHACDARDAEGLGRVVDDAQKRLGPITAVIHGAGVIEDRYLADKSRESFDRVLGAKIDPMLTLAALVNGERIDRDKLRLLVLFSSTSGFFGNAGQGDYAAANETLNRIARRLRDAWGVNACALNWGPWSGAGMVRPEVEKQFRERGVGMIDVPAGRRAARLEAGADHRAGVRIVLGDGAWIAGANKLGQTPGLSDKATPQAIEIGTPLLWGSRVTRAVDDRIEAAVEFNGSSVLLDEHRIDGAPVVPLAVVAETMAELAAAAEPELIVSRISKLRQLQGIVLKGDQGPEARTIHFVGERQPASDGAACWKVSAINREDRGRTMYQAMIELRSELMEPPPAPALVDSAEPYPLPIDKAYLEWLFHGPAYRLVSSVDGVDADGIDAVVQPSVAADIITSSSRGWLIDPVALDVGPQLVGFWSRALHNVTLLPSCFASFDCFGPLAGDNHSPLKCRLRVRSGPTVGEATVDIWYLRGGRVVGRFTGLECVGNRELNRITGVLHA